MEMKCPMCGSEELDGPRKLGGWRTEYVLKEWLCFSLPCYKVRVRYAWVCLQCGHVMLAVDPDELAKKLARHDCSE